MTLDDAEYAKMLFPVFVDFYGSKSEEDPVPLRVAFGVEGGPSFQYMINPYFFKGFKEEEHYKSLIEKQFLSRAKFKGLHPLAVCQKILMCRNMRMYAEDAEFEGRMLEKLMAWSGETITHGIEVRSVFRTYEEHLNYTFDHIKIKGVFEDSAQAVKVMIEHHGKKASQLELERIIEARDLKEAPREIKF